MKKLLSLCFAFLFMSLLGYAQKEYVLENDFISRKLSVDGFLHTKEIVNKQTGRKATPSACAEFALRFSQGTDKEGTDFILQANDFKVKQVRSYQLSDQEEGTGLSVMLENKQHALVAVVYYELPAKTPYVRKYITLESANPITLERVDVEVLALEDAHQPYTQKAITAQAPGNWSPGLGQPVYALKSALFMGVEFPAASNSVVEQQIRLGYLWGQQLTPKTTYRSYKSVIGVADDPEYIDDAFFRYIDDIRIRPLRLQIQYNSWFDFGQGVSEENFSQSVRYIHQQLSDRGVAPLNAYVIDDGWQDKTLPDLNREDGVWSINSKFSPDFKRSHDLMKEVRSTLGLWLSPGCFFGARPQVDILREKGYEALSLSMSMAGPKYMDKLEKRILSLTRQGVSYFKYDGLFGHLNTRDFELNGRGVPMMPQLETEGFAANDARLNHPKYDELKSYYLVAGTERLMQMMLRQHEINPNVFTAITNGAYLSPWWLQYTDVVWLINCGDAAGGANRNEELVYRDAVYYEVFTTENTKFPIHAIFNHEPKKTKTGESPEAFRDYLFMNISRGAGFIELYIKTKALSQSDWDVLAQGIRWAREIFPAFRRVRMFGGDPKQHQVYGYSGWSDEQGYVSVHNPSDKAQKITLTLDRSIGVELQMKNFSLTSPLGKGTDDLAPQWNYGQVMTLSLQPKEIRVLTFKRK